MIHIRNAREEDAKYLVEISKSRWISGSTVGKKTGLVDYRVPSEEKYARRTSLGLFYVAEDLDSKEIVGFLDCYKDNVLEETFPNDSVLQEIINSENERFAYINTWVVRENYEGRGLTFNFVEKLNSELEKEYKNLWCAIVHKPIKNIMSIAVSKRIGFNLEKEFELPGSCTFGLYKMKR
jgi:hypothetical protein